MDVKGLDVCNSLELDKEHWRGCCRDGRKEACYEDLDSLTVGLHAFTVVLRAPAQFIVTKQGEEAQTGPAEYLADLRLVADLRLDVSESRTHPDEDPQQAKP